MQGSPQALQERKLPNTLHKVGNRKMNLAIDPNPADLPAHRPGRSETWPVSIEEERCHPIVEAEETCGSTPGESLEESITWHPRPANQQSPPKTKSTVQKDQVGEKKKTRIR
jgi:hypothetical protein